MKDGELGGIADTVGFPVLPVFDVWSDVPHSAMNNAMAAMTARIANPVSRGETDVADIDVSPIVRSAYLSGYPSEPRMYRLTALGEDAFTLIARLSAVAVGLGAWLRALAIAGRSQPDCRCL